MNKILSIVFILLTWHSFGQIIEAETDPCLVNLDKAEVAYEGGNVEIISSLVRDCLDNNGLKKENRTKAYKLLIDSYIFQGFKDSANSYMVKFLKFNPEYEISEQTDRREFIDLHESYRNYPIFAFGIKGGIGLSQLTVFNEYGVHNTEDQSLSTSYKVKPGFSAELFGAYHPHRDGEIFLDLGYSGYKFEETSTLFEYADGTPPDGGTPRSEYNYTESVNSLNLSLGYKFMIRKSVKAKVVPYIGVGIRGGFLFSSNLDISRSIVDGSQFTDKGAIVNAAHLRNRWNSWATAMIGLKIKIPKGNILMEFGYDYNLYSISNPDERFNLSNERTNELLFRYNYVTNDFGLNNFYLKIGYNFNFYIPKKKKQFREKKSNADKDSKVEGNRKIKDEK